ncbi:MAG: ABC transporter permease [Intrasporangium sp.]|uniref:ABC transporter permease n=1 Tax=Intrasporangium sp. TaxID=1925024 RepID=UPI00264939BD|nr:ABC transporter permease [Intrasporangium sp.]MDN5794421.1 ABC transporter permease [Intrasporangium sp.]
MSWLSKFWSYLQFAWEDILELAVQHVIIVVEAVAIATVLGIVLGLATYHTQRPRELVLATTGAFLTIPSLALFPLFIPVFGLGWTPVLVGLVMYALLPIVRNTIVGLREVDPAVIESARGMGMGRIQVLLRIELPLAWPVVLTGMRVSTVVLVGIAAIGAYVNGPGLGNLIFGGLAQFGSASALNLVLGGTLGIVVLAIAFDLAYAIFFRLTTARGIR